MPQVDSPCRGRSRSSRRKAKRRSTLQWGPNFVQDLWRTVFEERLPPDVAKEVRDFLSDHKYGWSSACSGSDSPTWVYDGLVAYLKTQGISFQAYHVVSAELAPPKQQWIMHSLSVTPRQLYGDIFHITRDTEFKESINLCPGRHEDPDPNNETRSWWIGFSCQTASGLNTVGGNRWVAFIDEVEGTSGVTFSGVLLIIDKRDPDQLILENVRGLIETGQHLAVIHQLQLRNRHVAWWMSNPLDHGFPNVRHRVYFLVTKVSICSSVGMTEDDYTSFVAHVPCTLLVATSQPAWCEY